MTDRIREHLDSLDALSPGDLIVVGYSGGADSTVLLTLLRQMGYDVIAAYLHHGQRTEADQELLLCEAYCRELDVPFISGKADVPLMSKHLKIGLEEAGRHARYAFLEQVRNQFEASWIATAHNRTDHIETILLNLFRGTGMSGLKGIPAVRGNIIRPLLCLSREEIREYCQLNHLWTAQDPSNDDLQFARARVRSRILPEIEAIQPSYLKTIERMATTLSEEDAFLDGMAASALERSEIRLNNELHFLTTDCEIAFSRELLTQLPPVLFKRAIRLAIHALGGKFDYDLTLQTLEGIKTQENGSLTAEGGEVVLEWTPEQIHVRQLKPTQTFRYPLTLPGETDSEEFGWKLVAFAEPASGQPQSRASLSTVIAHESLVGNLYFRAVQPGDEMIPYGFSGKRKLTDILSESKLTQAARHRLPIICDMSGPVWIPGICLAERARLNDTTKQAICIRFEPLET